MSDDNFWMIMRWLFAALFFIAHMLRGIGVEADDAARAVKAMGFKSPVVGDVSIVFPSWNGCDAGDAAAFRVTAMQGEERVRLVVCSGYPFKAFTIRVK